MAREEKAIFMNLCMVYDGQGNILVQNRKNPNWPGITFPGGHVEAGESFADAVIREVWEETGLTIEQPVLCGIKQWGEKNGVRSVVLFYKTDRFHGTLRSSDEGEVFWIPRNTLQKYTLCTDFESMLKVFEAEDLSEFYYYQEDGNWKYKVI